MKLSFLFSSRTGLIQTRLVWIKMHILALTCALCLVVCNVTSAEDKQLKEEDIDDKIIGKIHYHDLFLGLLYFLYHYKNTPIQIYI